MAAKLILLFASLALFVLLANASTYRTVVEFEEEDGVISRSNSLKCQLQYYEQEELKGCQLWISKRAQQGRIGYEADDFELTLHENDESRRPQEHHPALKMCCDELRNLDKMCVCHTLKAAALQVKEEGMHQPRQVKHMFSTARNLPDVCDVPEVESCKFDATPW
ncbi:unnamed protein product [Microthlaspi erraticum]|uniref:Bifunctional inhibitor/plant lipid transfer protein/seed storage helical domain-containing protein n=1 Tax=Microthlaspi erraticum TaxID=1685480 RepID=A0A6D2KBM0_9BRAS|nr:unnamed protein product [Microthlaspi erraticum]